MYSVHLTVNDEHNAQDPCFNSSYPSTIEMGEKGVTPSTGQETAAEHQKA